MRVKGDHPLRPLCFPASELRPPELPHWPAEQQAPPGAAAGAGQHPLQQTPRPRKPAAAAEPSSRQGQKRKALSPIQLNAAPSPPARQGSWHANLGLKAFPPLGSPAPSAPPATPAAAGPAKAPLSASLRASIFKELTTLAE